MNQQQKDTGGSAFPTEVENYANANWCSEGMTLRDYFAAKAMQALVSAPDLPADYEEAFIARSAYWLADAMLTERNKK